MIADQDPIATLIIIGITVFVSYRAFSQFSLTERLLFSTRSILVDKEYHRVLSSALVHADWTHLGFNMFSFFMFARLIESAYGFKVMLFIYLCSIIGGSALALLLHRHHEYRAVGASGGVCGIIFSSIFLLPGGSIYMFFIPIAIPSWIYAILFLVFSYYAMRKGKDNIGHDAHLGGALAGLIISTIMYPQIIDASPELYATVVVLTLAMILYTWKFPMWHTETMPLPKLEKPEIKSIIKKVTPAVKKSPKTSECTMDELLDKVSEHGLHNLTAEERKRIEELSRKKGG